MTRPRTADAAQGKWRGILATLGVERNHLSGKHGPCPMCGGTDRFRFDDKEGRGTYYCSGCGAGTGFDLLQKLKGWDFKTAASEIDRIVGNCTFEAPRPAMDAAKRAKMLNELWCAGTTISEDDQAGGYLAGRGLQLPENRAALRFVPRAAAPLNCGGGFHPTMVAMIHGPDGTPTSLHRTFLGPNGKADIADPRATMPGSIPDGAAIRLAAVSPRMGIAEGIETALKASERFGIPVWAAINSTMLAKWQPPEGAAHVTVFGDNDGKFAGQAAAFTLAHKLATRFKIDAEVKIPGRVGADWADCEVPA